MHAPSLLWCIILAPFCASTAQRSTAQQPAVPVPPAPSHGRPQDTMHAAPAGAPSPMQQLRFAGASGLRSHSAIRSLDTPEDASNMSSMHMTTISRPFTVSNATVRGPVSATLQAQLEAKDQGHPRSAAGAFRVLLMRKKSAKKWPKCPRCRMTQCGRLNGKRYCSGGCRRKQKRFFCDSDRVAAPDCGRLPSLTLAEIRGEPSSRLRDYASVVVSVQAPYMGCADIANKPTACPARGTRVNLPGQRGVTVIGTICRKEYYVPDCLAPLYPFGVCECIYRLPIRGRPFGRRPRGRIIRAPCRTTDLPAGSGVGGADGSPSVDDIVVLTSGGETQTWFANFTIPGQKPTFEYNVTASVRSKDVDVSLGIFPELVQTSRNLQAGTELPEDYEDDYEADPEQEDLDYTPNLIPRDYEFESYSALPAY